MFVRLLIYYDNINFLSSLANVDLGQQELEFLGHAVTTHGVKLDQQKVQNVINWPKPTNISKLWGFLGPPRYYKNIIHRYGLLTRPLTNLLKKGLPLQL